jgi:4,4'-diaponeurosporenoate glycosyltransferase
VIEDVALARRFVAANEPVACFGGGDLVGFRMYDRPTRLVEGFVKNFAAGAGAVPVVRFVAIVGWITACLVAGWGVLAGSPVAFAVYGAFALQCFVMLRQLGNFGIVTALLYPVHAVVLVAVFLSSWRGGR